MAGTSFWCLTQQLLLMVCALIQRCTLFNRLRTGVKRYYYWQYKWGRTQDQSWDYGDDVQTMERMVKEWSLHSS